MIKTRKCKRCGLHYAATETTCPHCSGLSNHELKHIRSKRNLVTRNHAYYGRMFFYALGLIVVVMIIYKLRSR
jgi:hypothetical protein